MNNNGKATRVYNQSRELKGLIAVFSKEDMVQREFARQYFDIILEVDSYKNGIYKLFSHLASVGENMPHISAKIGAIEDHLDEYNCLTLSHLIKLYFEDRVDDSSLQLYANIFVIPKKLDRELKQYFLGDTSVITCLKRKWGSILQHLLNVRS